VNCNFVQSYVISAWELCIDDKMTFNFHIAKFKSIHVK
jgi:hypothetical protein